ncbi:hypothetical protein BBO99_00003490 [Phytophthora kernoviae]|uniref:Inositol polyphosphate-related phosphatase domain-containing protein n=2 Tax=Phytophthora kernoviae TaxID=325452 RepID=A0A3R7KVS8_9STRA|nr:hypothetical protein G195_006994 [Phytophthora kernoviae 00238/432]KAG2528020.1 hypothetical protein JM16_003119 [Phytophthora kernoviae]KAG2529465.1 hypothetical protein JM18_002782 [Phytophthora kernoviae]RLN02758.1 hypothetical protein BBI17_003518 [Phytophthora kernoviae]RLN81708.1 hypothetical protein BBO99_00003490 [Phytophthora kernoviae]
MVQKMVVVLSVFDAGLSFPKMFGNPMDDTDEVNAVCNVQALALHLFGLMSVFWNASIAHCFYRKIVHRDSETRLKSRFKLYLILVIVPSVAISVTLYAGRWFGDATFYCWVTTRTKQFWTFYLFVVFAILYISVILWVTHNRISRDFRDANLDAQESWALITSKLRVYIAAFIVLWMPSTIFRLFDSELGPARFPVAILMQITVCTQGLTTAIIYGGLLTKLYRMISCEPSITPAHKFVSSPSFPTVDTGTDHSLVKHYRQPANIFVSTFNMGEARLTPAQLEKWGKSKVWRRNRDSQDILKELHLNLEDVGFEFPHVHHHSFVLGDLNYRLTQRDASADTILELVSNVRKCETAKPSPIKRNRSLRRGLLGKRWSPMSSRGLSTTFGLGSSRGAGSDRDSNDLDVSMLERSVKSGSSSILASSNGSNNSARYSADCELPDDDQYVWDDVLVHDELRNGIRDEQIFYGFREAKIAFPPTFRRVRGAALNLDAETWSVEELAECYTTAVEGHGMRVPSYTDRILYFSQPDMRHRLRCAVYASCEEVNCSDHKPVLAVFQALVNRNFLPIETELATKKLQRMQDVSGVLECQLRLDFTSISWQPIAEGIDLPSLASIGGTVDLDQRFSSYDRHGHQVIVTIVFPLPSEDIFSAQRKLLELADSMSGGVYLENTDRLLCKTNVAHIKWTDFVRDGITHATFARPTGNMHVAIKIHAGTQGPCFGQGVICIPQGAGSDNEDGGLQNLKNFVVELADGGRHTGTLSGAVSLTLVQRASDA